MLIPDNIIANADDFGLNASVNRAILYCFENGIINSTSIMTNRPNFDEAVDMVHANKSIKNVGLHTDFVNCKPASDFPIKHFLLENGDWNQEKTDRPTNLLSSKTKGFFYNEIESQIQKAIKARLKLTHIDSHCQLHTFPCYYKIFIRIAEKYNLQLRLSESLKSGNYLKFLFRKFLNNTIKKSGCNYSDSFETVDHFLTHGLAKSPRTTIEVMLHPQFNESGELTDHYSPTDMSNWISWLQQVSKS